MLSLGVSVLRHPVLPLKRSVLWQPELPLHVSVLLFYSRLCYLGTCLSYSSLYCLSMSVCSVAAFAVLGLVWSIAACAALGRAFSTAVYAVPEHICVSLLQYSSLTCLRSRVSIETSFDSKQTELEPKLVSALCETKRLFRLFCFYSEKESFGASIEPKQTEEQPKQFDREQILVFFRKFWVILFIFVMFRNSLFWLFCCYIKTESFDVSIEPKQTEDQPKQFDREHILVFFRKFRVVSVCF
jgi:hypothetical protein